MKHIYSAGIITYTTQKKEILYLLLHYQAGHWDFPKGKIDKGETKEHAALRELHEEAGIIAALDNSFCEEISYIFTDYDDQLAQKTAYFFIGKAENTKIILSHEHTDFAWLPYIKAIEQLTYKNAQLLLKKAHKHILSSKQ